MHKPGDIIRPVNMIASLFLLFTGIGFGASRLNPHNERRTKT
jgi:hypothetical protein